MKVTCSKCGYTWDSKSRLVYVTCPSCQYKNKIGLNPNNYVIEFIHEWDHEQYYQGHSDLFDKELKACIPLTIPFNWWKNDEGLTGIVHETIGELKTRIIHELNAYDFSDLEKWIQTIPDHRFRQALNECLGDPSYNNMDLALLFGLETCPDADYSEFYHYCYFHIY